MFEEIVPVKLDKEKMIDEIETIVNHLNISYIDAVIMYCEANGIEVETGADIIKGNSKIVNSLQRNYEDLHYLPKQSRLPV